VPYLIQLTRQYYQQNIRSRRTAIRIRSAHMLSSALLAFLHHAAFIVVTVALAVEFTLFARNVNVENARRIQRADALYGAAALLLLVVGLLRVFYFEKGAGYYFGNAFFIAKLVTFVGVGALSIYPTLRFLKWDAQVKNGRAPAIAEREFKLIRRIMHLELLGLIAIALFAALMARGFG
jgi:putative membrane protein